MKTVNLYIMKKILIILITLLFLCSCDRSYKCVVKYEVSYPDTTWVNTYVFNGSISAHPNVYRSQTGLKTLEIYPGSFSLNYRVISAVSFPDADINVIDYKMYKYGVDIPNKVKYNESTER